MNSVIALALIIDLSGSMHQKILERPKYEVLKTKLSALSTSLDENDKVFSISFGVKNYSNCNSIQENTHSKKNFGEWVGKQSPSPFSKTPLTKAIRALEKKLTNNSFQHVLIITDGSDTCDEDPCQAISSLDKKLRTTGGKLAIDVVGFDIENKDKQLSCYIDKSGNLSFQYHQAKSEAELDRRLKNIDRNLKNSQIANQADVTKNLAKEIASKQALLYIKNAPDIVEFYAKGDKGFTKNWKGGFQVKLPLGSAKVGIKGLESKQKNIQILPDKENFVLYEDLVGTTSTEITLEDSEFPITLVPIDAPGEEQGKAASSSNKKFENNKIPPIARKKVILTKGVKFKVASGHWIAQIDSPWWLQGPLDMELHLLAKEDIRLNLKSALQNKFKWVDVEPKNQTQAIILNGLYGGEYRVLVWQGTEKIPIPNQWSWYWIKP